MNLSNKIEPLQRSITYALKSTKDYRYITHCSVCNNDTFNNLSQFIPAFANQSIYIQCRQCGFITYTPQLANLIDYYKTNTLAQNHAFFKTKETKEIRHRQLLFKFLDTLNKEDVKKMNFLDYGCSDGYLMKLFEEYCSYLCPETRGIELNRGHANWGRHINDLNITTNADLKSLNQKFDLVCLYHVLEHIQDMHVFIEELKKYVLNDNAYIYVALPTTNKLEYPEPYPTSTNKINVFFKDEHVNIFTDKLLDTFFELHNFKKVFEDKYKLYGQCCIYQLKQKTEKIKTVDWAELFKDSDQVFQNLIKAYSLKKEGDKLMIKDKAKAINFYRNALKIQPNFSEAYSLCLACLDPTGNLDFLDDMKILLPDSYEIEICLGLVYFQEQQYENSIEHFMKALEVIGYNELAYSHLGYCHMYLGNVDKAIDYFRELLEQDNYRDPGKINVVGAVLAQL